MSNQEITKEMIDASLPKITKYVYPICPECGKNTIVGFARPNLPWKNNIYDYDQKTAELYCCNDDTNCKYRIPFSALTTPLTVN
jgi:hypothetical protein